MTLIETRMGTDNNAPGTPQSQVQKINDTKMTTGLRVKRRPKKKEGATGGLFEATFGGGEGVIEADAFSGDLHLLRR